MTPFLRLLAPCLVALASCAPRAIAAEVAPSNPVPAASRDQATYPAWDLVLRAAQSYARDKEPQGSPSSQQPFLPPHEDLTRQRGAVTRNAAALKSVRQALALGIVRPPSRTLADHADDQAIRAFARLQAQESRMYAADKNWGEAARSALDSIDLAVQSVHGAAQMPALIGWAMERTGRSELAGLQASLPAEIAKQSALRLLQIDANRAKLVDIVQAERAFSLHQLREQIFSPQWQAQRSAMPKYEDLPQQRQKGTPRAVYEAQRNMSAEDILAEFQQHTDLIVAWAKTPVPRDWTKPIGLPKARFPVTRLTDDIWGGRSMVFDEARAMALTRLQAVQLAIRAFELEQGQLPQTLQELTPHYLAAVPLDPFSGQPLQWKQSDAALYSVGPDGLNDGGKSFLGGALSSLPSGPPGLPPRPAPKPRTTDNERIRPESKGDIVLHCGP